jgi:hypothetical protein
VPGKGAQKERRRFLPDKERKEWRRSFVPDLAKLNLR